MRIIKLAFLSVIILFGLLIAISFFLPSTIVISRAIDIFSTKDKVYNDIRKTSHWELWVENGDSLPVSFNLHQEHAVFVLGTTKAWVISSKPDQIITNWQSGNGQIFPAEFNFIEHQDSEQIKLQWKFVQKVNWYPWEKFASIVSEKVLGKFMEASLNNLKQHVEEGNSNQNTEQ